jgi:type 1 glutamine amidotransferase
MKCKPVLIFHSLLKKSVFVIILIISGFALSNCSESTGANNNQDNIRALIVGGGSSHDFDRWYKQTDAETLERGGFATIRYTDNTDSIIHYLPEVDVLYLSNNQPINDPAVRQAIFDFVEDGNGLLLGHAALWYNWKDWPEYNAQLVSGGSRGHDPYGSFRVNIVNTEHPITENVEQSFTLEDELYYYKPDPAGPGVEVLATASAEGSEESFPSVFVVKHDKGRIVGLALGHDAESHDLPAYQTLLRNSVKWAAGE